MKTNTEYSTEKSTYIIMNSQLVFVWMMGWIPILKSFITDCPKCKLSAVPMISLTGWHVCGSEECIEVVYTPEDLRIIVD